MRQHICGRLALPAAVIMATFLSLGLYLGESERGAIVVHWPVAAAAIGFRTAAPTFSPSSSPSTSSPTTVAPTAAPTDPLPRRAQPWYACTVLGVDCKPTPWDATYTTYNGTVGFGEVNQTDPPLIVWTMMSECTPEPNYVQRQNARFLPDRTQVRWVNDEMAAAIIRDTAREHNVPDLCTAFFEMRAGAFRADIFRFAVLLRYGRSLWLDHKMMLAQDISSFINLNHQDKSAPFFWAPKEVRWMGPGAICIAAMYTSKPGLPLPACVLRQQVENIVRRKSHTTENDWRAILDITGPTAVRRGVLRYEQGECGPLHEVTRNSQLVKNKPWEEHALECGCDYEIRKLTSRRRRATQKGEKRARKKRYHNQGLLTLFRSNSTMHLARSPKQYPRYEALYRVNLDYCSTPFQAGLLNTTGIQYHDQCYLPPLLEMDIEGGYGLELSQSDRMVVLDRYCAVPPDSVSSPTVEPTAHPSANHTRDRLR